VEDLDYILGLQQHLSHLRVDRDDIHDLLSALLGGGLDDIVPVEDLRVVVFVDVLIDPLEVRVEHLLVAIFIQLIEELIQFSKYEVVIVLLDECEELLLRVDLLLDFKDTPNVFNEGYFSAVQLLLQLVKDAP
jgi:hypothetical protein